MIRIGIDTGGTFTDFILYKNGKRTVYKIPSNPSDPAKAILYGLSDLLNGTSGAVIFHGSTVATNALLERKGSRVALLTTRGFEDVLDIGRQNRAHMFDLYVKKPESLVHSRLRIGIPERTSFEGKPIKPLTDSDMKRALREIKKLKPQSLAICLLHSYANPSHEKKLEKAARKLRIPVSVSSDIVPEYREVERFSTTVVNAYVSPKMETYLKSLSNGLKRNQALRMMQSNGGFTGAKTASRQAVRTLVSGPAAGVVAAHHLGMRTGFPDLITFDMGGTSTDVSLCPGSILFTNEGEIAGCPVKTPFIRIHTIGAGGGSIVWADPGGSLRVGPESAGALPGPICYRRGGRKITVTDAHLFLGRLNPRQFLGGRMALNSECLQKPFGQLAKNLRLRPHRLAEGIIEIANANMERALRVVSIEQGKDPKKFALVAFGGAGGLHAADLARSLQIPVVIIPKNPGLFSAMGLLMSDSIKEYSQGVVKRAGGVSRKNVSGKMNRLIRKGLKEILEEGIPRNNIRILRFLDMRYEGQSYEMTVPYSRQAKYRFHQLHQALYGHMDSDQPVEIVNLRVRLIGKIKKPSMKPLPLRPLNNLKNAKIGRMESIFSEKRWDTPFYDRAGITPGTTIKGPAIICEYSATTTVPPDFVCRVDRYENLILEKHGG